MIMITLHHPHHLDKICALSCVFAVVVMPETKGKSLEQIQDELHGRTHSPVRTSISASSKSGGA